MSTSKLQIKNSGNQPRCMRSWTDASGQKHHCCQPASVKVTYQSLGSQVSWVEFFCANHQAEVAA